LGPQLFFDGTFLDVSGEFSDRAFSAEKISATGTLERVHQGLVPLGGQQGQNGRVWEYYLLEVDDWHVVAATE
jgi:hypothetical protein